jgi:putative DNA-invertase from lambdoid prophage Rac
MVFTVLGAVAELERNIIRERVTAGLRRAKKEGKTLGRPRVHDRALRSLFRPGSAGLQEAQTERASDDTEQK